MEVQPVTGAAMSKRAIALVLIAAALVLAACGGGSSSSGKAGSTSDPSKGGGTTASGVGIHKIKHVIIIMQENRSFDSYFGTFPGADGIPMKGGKPAVCLRNPDSGGCQAPYPDHADQKQVGGHWEPDMTSQIDGGKMDGFLSEAETAGYCKSGSRADCDVMGYHTGSDLPNYWSYAKHFVLQDHMFEPVASWTVPSHLYLVSGWAASCHSKNPMSCSSYINLPVQRAPFAWTDLTYLLHKHHVSWGWYLDQSVGAGVAVPESDRAPFSWVNVLPSFTDVASDRQAGNLKTDSAFFRQARSGTLPSVSWLMPDLEDS
jgi:phospholipase C